MKLFRGVFVGLCLWMGTLNGWAQSADKQFSFAESLFQEGHLPYSIVEFKRFIHFYDSNFKVPEAKLFLANIYMADIGTLSKAADILSPLTKEGSEIAKSARVLLDFLNQYSKDGKEGLVAFMQAKHQEMRNQFADASKRYYAVYRKHERNSIAPLALFASAKLNLQQLNQAQVAFDHLKEALKEFPNHPRKAEIEFMLIQAIENIQGSNNEVLAAYRTLSTQQPRHPFADQSMQAVKRIEDLRYALKRTFSKEKVKPYRVLSQRTKSGTYTVETEIAKAISEEEIKATLEDCLLATYDKRPDRKSKMLVKAYFTYPLTEAGTVSWTPGEVLNYHITKQKSEDVITDTIFDLFRNR